MFKKLIADLQGLSGAATLAKSQNADADDANIQAAAATGGDAGSTNDQGASADAGAGADGGDGGDGGDGDGAGAGEEDLSKSFEIELPSGQKVQAFDASEMLKSLTARQDAMESGVGEALGLAVDLIKSLSADNAAMHEQLAKLSATGGGRKAMLAIVPRNGEGAGGTTTLAKSAGADNGMKPSEFLLKSEQAFDAQKISGRELSLIETHINRAEAIPAHLIQKVMAAGSGA
jgi:hypothetical protein